MMSAHTTGENKDKGKGILGETPPRYTQTKPLELSPITDLVIKPFWIGTLESTSKTLRFEYLKFDGHDFRGWSNWSNFSRLKILKKMTKLEWSYYTWRARP